MITISPRERFRPFFGTALHNGMFSHGARTEGRASNTLTSVSRGRGVTEVDEKVAKKFEAV